MPVAQPHEGTRCTARGMQMHCNGTTRTSQNEPQADCKQTTCLKGVVHAGDVVVAPAFASTLSAGGVARTRGEGRLPQREIVVARGQTLKLHENKPIFILWDKLQQTKNTWKKCIQRTTWTSWASRTPEQPSFMLLGRDALLSLANCTSTAKSEKTNKNSYWKNPKTEARKHGCGFLFFGWCVGLFLFFFFIFFFFFRCFFFFFFYFL